MIDLVGEGPDGEVIMFIVEERPWDTSPSQVDDLREKLLSYAGFVADGSLVRLYPDLEGRSVRIQLDCPEQPTDAIAALLDQAAPSLSEFGITLSLNVRGPSAQVAGACVRVLRRSRSDAKRPRQDSNLRPTA